MNRCKILLMGDVCTGRYSCKQPNLSTPPASNNRIIKIQGDFHLQDENYIPLNKRLKDAN